MRSPRAAARRTMLRKVSEIRKRVENLKWWWTCESYVYGLQPDGSYRRERQLNEYPEMQERYWLGTVQEIDEIIEQLMKAREFAIEEFKKTEE